MRILAIVAWATVMGALSPLAWGMQSGRSSWEVRIDRTNRRAHAVLQMPRKDVARAMGLDAQADILGAHAEQTRRLLADRLSIYNNKSLCPSNPSEESLTQAEAASHLRFAQVYRCDSALGAMRLTNTVLTNDRAGYQHLGRVQVEGAAKEYRTVFDASHANFFVQAGPNDMKQARSREAGFHWIVGMFALTGLGVAVWTLVVLRRSRRRERAGAHEQGGDP